MTASFFAAKAKGMVARGLPGYRKGVESWRQHVCLARNGAHEHLSVFLSFPSFFIGVRGKQSIPDSRDVTKDARWLIRSDTLGMNGSRTLHFPPSRTPRVFYAYYAFLLFRRWIITAYSSAFLAKTRADGSTNPPVLRKHRPRLHSDANAPTFVASQYFSRPC